MQLPKKKVKAQSKNPRTLIVYSQPKMGKTTLLSNLDNALIIDLEQGSRFLDALKVEVNTWEEMIDFIKSIKEENTKVGGFAYDYGVIDTVSKLEELVLPYALELYQRTPMGKNYTDDILSLPQGAGYGYLRKAMNEITNLLKNLFPRLIFIGHLKEKITNKDGKEVTSKDLAMTGKLSQILCANVDAVGYLSRDKKDNLSLSFKASDELACGARADHLRGQVITVAEKEGKEIKYFWDRIFIPE